MLKYGKETGVPETYRITLAVSVALLAHTLLMAAFPFALPEHNHNPVIVRVQLVPEGSMPAVETSPAQASSPARATPFTIEEVQEAEPVRTVQSTSSPQPRSVPEPGPEPAAAPATRQTSETRNSTRLEPEAPSTPSPGANASQSRAAGARATPQDKTEEDIKLESEAPSEKSSYLSLLVQTIARKAKIPRLDDFEEGQILSVELELNLMSNGALVGARITESSGNDGLDQRVYRAALAASPYPEPPSSGSRQQRFRVEVKYTF